MDKFIGMITERFEDAINESLRRALAPVAPYLKKLTLGMVVMVLAVPMLNFALICVAGAVFAGFSGHADLVAPALWTALVFGVLALLAITIGLSLVRRPR